MKQQIFHDPAVHSVFEGFPDPVRERLHALRHLVFDVAASTRGVGRVTETLKWGEMGATCVSHRTEQKRQYGTFGND